MQGAVMPEVASISHGIGAGAFLCLAIILLFHKPTYQKTPWIIVACVFTSLWASLASLYGFKLLENYQWVVLSEVAQDGSWCLALASMIVAPSQASTSIKSRRMMLSVFSFGLFAMMLNALLIHQQWLPGKTSSFVHIDFIGHLALSVLGLSLVEQLYRGILPQRRWGIKFFCIGIGALFTYDFVMYAHALLFERLDENLWYARGGINLIVAPMVAVSAFRNKRWNLDVAPSRILIYRSTVIVTCGLYLIAMAAVGYTLRAMGGHWGKTLAVLVIFSSGLLLLSLLVSGKARAYLKLKLARHVFRLYYDYREEWLGFSQLLGRSDSDLSLHTRVIVAFADMVESPEGLLFEKSGDHFVLKEGWNISLDLPKIDQVKVCQYLGQLTQPALLRDLKNGDETERLVFSCFSSFKRGWLLVPLSLNEVVEGFVVLGRSRVRVDINWEVSDLLETASTQATAFLCQQRLADALHVAKQFESYHQISAFMLHDIKNLLSSTQLILQNKKHASDPRFVETMFITLDSIHQKLSKLQNQLHNPISAWSVELVDLKFEVEQLVAECRLKSKLVLFDCQVNSEVWVQLDRESFKHCMMHLIDNGIEASPKEQSIEIILRFESDKVRVIVKDYGAGMSQYFINNQLFKPFVSTKGQKGMGIGVFQVKSFVERASGVLSVESVQGQGTSIMMDFPEYKRASLKPAIEKNCEETVS